MRSDATRSYAMQCDGAPATHGVHAAPPTPAAPAARAAPAAHAAPDAHTAPAAHADPAAHAAPAAHATAVANDVHAIHVADAADANAAEEKRITPLTLSGPGIRSCASRCACCSYYC